MSADIRQEVRPWGPLPPLAAAALDDPKSGVLVLDPELRVLHATSCLKNLLGVPEDSCVEGLLTPDLLALADLDAVSVGYANATLLNSSGESSALRSRDNRREIHMRLRSIGGGYQVASFAEPNGASAGDFAQFDPVTGLLSRRWFELAVASVLSQDPSQPWALILVDLDRFKAVNDTLGHAAGDAVLRLAGGRFQSLIRKTDLVGRLGGDEFAILTANDPTFMARRVLDLVQRTYIIEGSLVNVGTSMGIALAPADGLTCDVLLKKADLALYQSKSSGRGTFHFFHPSLETRAQARRTNELELRRALSMRQLELYYQPQVNTTTGRLTGFEALIRWRHPVRGLIPPLEFLAIAEEIGVIVPIGEWVLRTACREATKWPDELTVAVNASPLQFETGRFAEAVQSALSSSGLRGSRLEVEITEGILLRDEESVVRTLKVIREMGVRIAMDDFGTGYASLSQLAHFPFDKIKIDRSLAGFEGDDPKQRAIVRAIATLGTSLGVSVIAEGVENAAQVARLELDGCRSVQGYYFSKPVPTSEVGGLIERLCPERKYAS